MAEFGQGGEKTEEPSQRRLEQARERGQVLRSRELITFATMMGGSTTLLAIGGALAARMSQIMRTALSVDAQRLGDPRSMAESLGEATLSALTALWPLLGALTAVALLGAVVLGGWNFSTSALAPDFTRMNPSAGLKRLFGLHGASELGKAMLKCLVIGAVCAAIAAWLFKDVMALGQMAPRAAIARGAGLLGWAFIGLAASLALIALVDVPLQIFQYRRSLKMTRRELRDEAKEADGPPETKQRIRRMQQQSARGRLLHKVLAAQVVIVDPTRVAVALGYDPKAMHAPRVLAKGADLAAATLRRLAEEHRVPVFESPKLARALYESTDLDREIPAGLYAAVAQILSYIFRIRILNPTVAARVARPDPHIGADADA